MRFPSGLKSWLSTLLLTASMLPLAASRLAGDEPGENPSTEQTNPKETAEGPDKLLENAVKTLKDKDLKTFFTLMTETQRPPKETQDRIIEQMKQSPQQMDFLVTIFEAAQKVKPEMKDEGSLAIYKITVTPPNGKEEAGHLVLKKAEGKWLVETMVPGEYDPAKGRRTPGTQMNKLKQIGLALHNYHDAKGSLPGNITDENGKPLLSWRVAILPYLEEEALYKKFKLDEPWDSEHNMKLLAEMPEVYQDLNPEDKKGQTSFLAPVSKGTLLGHAKGVKFQEVNDGLSNTIMVVRTSKTKNWSEPVDFEFDPNKPETLGKDSGLDGMALIGDGSVKIFRDYQPEKLIEMFIMNDGKDGRGE